MSDTRRFDAWGGGPAYEAYVGRWSRHVARTFVAWLGVPDRSSWLDVGCGTGELSRVILDATSPRQVRGIDPAEGFVEYARAHTEDDRAAFEVADAQDLPHGAATFDAVVSGLVLNFVPQPARAATEMARVTVPGGRVGAYVWDYAGEMQMMRYFWDAAAAVDPDADILDEGQRFPICRPDALRELFTDAGLTDVETQAIDVETRFSSFEDYWSPFLGGQGSAPGYVASLSEEHAGRLKDHLRTSLPIADDGSIDLIARAWAVRGTAGG